MMKTLDPESFALDNFTGPLSFLLHLIQKHEIDINDIPLQKITAQFREKESHSMENGAEFIGTTAFLLWLKSKMLLPQHEQVIEDEELDPHFEIIHQLLAYCHIKEAAKDLAEREHAQASFFSRGVPELPEAPKNLGIEHLSIEDFAKLFQTVLNRAPAEKGKIQEETFRVSDKIKYIRALFQKNEHILFETLFTAEKSKGELIVTFLAILELMKLGEGAVGRLQQTGKCIIARVTA